MGLFKQVKPEFWEHKTQTEGHFKHLFNFRRIWKTAVLVMGVVALVPLITMTAIDYNVTREAILTEILLRTTRFVSNTWRTVSFFITEHRLALDIIKEEHTYEELIDAEQLADIQNSMQNWIGGGCTDLGVIDAEGRQTTYVGPYNLEGKDYSDQAWFREVRDKGVYISEVFLGLRNEPHMVVAVRKDLPDGSFYVLRASLDTERFNTLLSQLEIDSGGDAFLINRLGVLQTDSRHHGKILETLELPVPAFATGTQVYEAENPRGDPIIVGYAYIPDTPFIQMVVKQKGELMAPWHRTRLEIIGFLAASIFLILVAILGVASYLVKNMFESDKRRLWALHRAEYSNKMASVGRLAAGVSHEINNPLAVINEKAGLIKDLFIYSDQYRADPKLIGLVDSVIHSVERCGAITKRLLSFARQSNVSFQPLHLGEVIWDVLSFMNKEAEYKSIKVQLFVEDNIPQIDSDRGNLQQILINLINNAISAMDEGGRLDIRVDRAGENEAVISIADTGCGIPPEDLDRIFEPFFSTKTDQDGTGLGLSITYGLVKKLGGRIKVESEVGKGTRFTVTLPMARKGKEVADHARTAG